MGGMRTSRVYSGANELDVVGALGAAPAPMGDPPSSMRKFLPWSLIQSPVVSTLRQNSTASTPGSRTSWRAPNAGNGDWSAFCLYTTVPGGLSSGGRSCQSWETAERITPQWSRSPNGALGSHWRLMVWTPWGLVLTVAMSCLPSGRGMPIMSVTSPRMAARTVTAFRRARDGPTEGLADPVLLDASRSAGSTTRRDLRWEGGGRRVIVSHRFLYDARAAWTPSTEVKTEVHRPNDHEVKKPTTPKARDRDRRLTRRSRRIGPRGRQNRRSLLL